MQEKDGGRKRRSPSLSLGREDEILTPTAVATALGRSEIGLVPAVIYLISSHLRRSRHPSFSATDGFLQPKKIRKEVLWNSFPKIISRR